MTLLVNIDVDDLERAARFYCEALGLRIGRRFDGATELLGASSPLYLLSKPGGSIAFAGSSDSRHYRRHWTPVHLDFVVDDVDAALQRARQAGASVEQPPEQHAYGRRARLADPFGNGFCLLQFTGRGYDEIAQ